TRSKRDWSSDVCSSDLQHCHRADGIATAIRLAEEFGYRLVINHGTEGHKIADYIAAKGIDVILGPLMTTRSKVELRDRTLATARSEERRVGKGGRAEEG